MSTPAVPATAPSANSLFSAFLPLLPFMLAVFIGFLPMGMALPVLPRYVHDTLGQGTVMVGVVMGSQFAASLFARLWAGSVSDARGARVAALTGLAVGACVGIVYLVSTLFTDTPRVAVGVLIAARLLVGIAEGFFITANLSWGVARLGPAHAGKVIGWIGVALFAAYGVGAPLGVWVMERFGFAGLGVAALLIPLVSLAGTWWFIPGVAPSAEVRPPIRRVIRAVRLPGLALTFTAAGFAMINAFVPLLFAQRGWGTGALAFTSMGVGFIAARMVLGHLPDKLGGARVALYCVAGEAVGLLMIWAAPNAFIACAGALLAGGGYAIGFQGFGVEAVQRTPPQSRGSAMGAYVAFQDVCMGLAAPLGGVLAHAAGVDAVYLAAAVAAMAATVLAGVMVRRAS